MQQSFKTTSADKGKKLLTFLKEKLGMSYSVRRLKFFIDHNLCLVGGRVERFSCAKLAANVLVSIALPIEKEAYYGQLIFQNDDFLVWNKPIDLCSSGDKSLEEHLKQKFPTIKAVHRLDRNTSGLIIFALHKESKKVFEELFLQRAIEKAYLAIVEGQTLKAHGSLKSYLGRKKTVGGQARFGSGGTFFAHTDWKREKALKKATLLRCFPKTGRTHQIRVHLKEMGHVIVGDYLYGSQAMLYHAKRPLLHAASLRFSYNGQIHQFQAKLPSDFKKALLQLSY